MPNFPITDTHLHLWDPQKFNYDWIKDIEPLNRSFHLSNYNQHCQSVDVGAMVFVQCDCGDDQGVDEARWIAALAEEDPRIRGIVAFAPIEKEAELKPYLEQLTGIPLVKGIRRLLHVVEDRDFCLQLSFISGVQLLADFGLSFDICARHDQLGSVIQMVEQCPQVNFMLDHIGGSPDLIVNDHRESWRGQIQRLADFENVYCKVSGMVTMADLDNWTAADLTPYVNDVIDAFGWHRVAYGGDWPVSTLAAEYPQWVEALDQIINSATEVQKRQIYQQNAANFYRLDW